MSNDGTQVAVSLVAFRVDHITKLLEWRAQPEAQLHQPISPLSRDRLVSFLDRRHGKHYLDLIDMDNIIMINDSDLGIPVGWMTMEVTSRMHGLVRVGYTISKDFWSKGYATAAVTKLATD